MQCYLFTDADTRLTFKNRAQAFVYADKHSIPSMVLTVYTTVGSSLKCSVYNPFLKIENCIEYFESESDALKYIGSFL